MADMKTTQTVWLFDLDNTLHHADAGIFTLINRAMTEYMARRLNVSKAQASHLREDYWHKYGATLAGLQMHHPEIDIGEFLAESHPMPEILAALQGFDGTRETLSVLKGRKAVFSNGPSFYVNQILTALGIEDLFEYAFGTDDFGLLYKPEPQAYLNVCRRLDAAPEQCVMVDDSAANLHAAKELGMTTVWFGSRAHDLPFADGTARNMAELAKWAENGVFL